MRGSCARKPSSQAALRRSCQEIAARQRPQRAALAAHDRRALGREAGGDELEIRRGLACRAQCLRGRAVHGGEQRLGIVLDLVRAAAHRGDRRFGRGALAPARVEDDGAARVAALVQREHALHQSACSSSWSVRARAARSGSDAATCASARAATARQVVSLPP